MKLGKMLACHCAADGLNKRKILELISEMAARAQPNIDSSNLTHALLQRERLGSTYLGNGIAVPHAKVAMLNQPTCIVITLNSPIEYDDSSKQIKADLFFALLIPEDKPEQHLPLLSQLVDYLNDPSVRDNLRQCKTNEQLYKSLESLPELCNSAV